MPKMQKMPGPLQVARKNPYGLVGKHIGDRRAYLVEYKRMRRKEMKERAFIMVGRGRVECGRCGNKDARMLQVNHRNGNGGLERRTKVVAREICDDIVSGKRKIDDLDLLCEMCNWATHIEKKYGIVVTIKTEHVRKN